MSSTNVYNGLKVLAWAHFSAFSVQLDLLMQAFEREGARVYRTSYKSSKLGKTLDMLWNGLRVMPRSDVIVLQGHSNYNIFQTAIGIFYARIFRKPSVLLFYGGKLAEEYPRWPWIYNWVFRNTTCIVAASGYIGGLIEGWGFPVTIVPHIIKDAVWPYRQRDELRPRLLYLRSMDADDYNPMLAIRTLKRLLPEFPDLTMTMIGKGTGRAELEEVVERENLPVTFMQNVEHDDLIKVIAEHDIFINTPNFDNQPVCLIEAMTSGMPIVTTNVGGIPWMFEDGEVGYLVDRDDDAAMADRVRELLRTPGLGARMSARGPEVGRKWLWESLKPQYAEILRDVLPAR